MTDAAKARPQKQGQKTAFRVSVRELAEFSYFPEDILPGGSGLEEMWAGTRAHQARQKDQEGETERPVKRSFSCMGEEVTVYGRMDAFTPGPVPFVEEMKLCGPETRLTEAFPAHRAQALTYAALVALENDAEAVRFCVSYISETGHVLQAFEETLPREELLGALEKLLQPYMVFLIGERNHRENRDESIRAMAFPFPTYREGQREMAAQVYTAIDRRKRLFASLPTGTGKSAAVLFPALKAMGEGKTGKLLYLTARTTARQSPLHTLERMLAQGLSARVMTLSAKEKMCLGFARCHPSDCPRAQGHYLRQRAAIDEIKEAPYIWTDARVTEMADKHRLCPFEFALALTEMADVVLMDLNYAFDPFAQLKRLFLFRRDMTLLIDEAHHVVERVRESLSGILSSQELSGYRSRFGKAVGRKHPYYKALTGMVEALRGISLPGMEPTESEEAGPMEPRVKEDQLKDLPQDAVSAAEGLCEAAFDIMAAPLPSREVMGEVSAVLRLCSPFLYAAEHMDEDYAVLLSQRGRERTLEIYCLLPAKEIARVTMRMRGTVFFSATMDPLSATKQLLGGDEEDACFSLPSPFPLENLAVVRRRISTRYQMREKSALAVAQSIAEATQCRQGKYIAYFPSYAYLRLVRGHLEMLETPPIVAQESDMDEEARARFLEGFSMDASPKLGLCVLGSLFSEGIDLPGEQLIGAVIVGVGLPVPTLRVKAVQACYARHFGDGFAYACRIPGMQKVVQAGGRVIRTETDRGLILLLDDRYYDPDYIGLLPEHWRLRNENIRDATRQWRSEKQ